MTFFSKLVIYLLLSNLFALLQFSNASIFGIIPSNTTVLITNNLSRELQLGVHCKDKNTDLGFQVLLNHRTYSFQFWDGGSFSSKLYFCQFNWIDGDHFFDVFDDRRDFGESIVQWDIKEQGPCKVKGGSPRCYPWNSNTDPEFHTRVSFFFNNFKKQK